jgi:hypothetical protein
MPPVNMFWKMNDGAMACLDMQVAYVALTLLAIATSVPQSHCQ